MLLNLFLTILIFCIFFLLIFFNKNFILSKIIAILGPAIIFILSAVCLCVFDFADYITFFEELDSKFDVLNLNFPWLLDPLSYTFIALSNLLIFLTILFSWYDKEFNEKAILLLIINLLLLLSFGFGNLIGFYVSFEAILIPMYLLIGLYGSRERKIRALYLFFFYTLFTSLLMLIGLIYIYSLTGSLDIEYILTWKFTFEEQCWLWLSFFFSFASKIPLFPFHIWLPEAHVEAPTIGSVLLAGILLKLGVYGFLRFSLPLFPEASLFFSPLVYLLSILGVIYASLSAIRQTDFKRIIAYSSVAHMNLVVLGIFSFNTIGIEGSILQSISHGFVAGAMFFLIGILYSRYHSRLVFYFNGLVHMMPVFAVFFLIFTMANIALPGTSSFIGEFLLLCGIYKTNGITAVFGALGVILCGAYSLWLYNRIMFGNLKIVFVTSFKDIDFKEFSILIPLLFFVFLMGVYPSFFFHFFHFYALNLSIISLT